MYATPVHDASDIVDVFPPAQQAQAGHHLLRGGDTQKLYNEVTLGRKHGMVSLEESLARMVEGGLLEPEEARLRASRPEELASLLTGGS